MILGFNCNKGNVPYNECKGCKEECFPRPYLDYVIQKHYDSRNLLSPSMMFNCKRKTLLAQYHEIYADPASFYWTFYGTVVHHVLEGWDVPGAIKEKRITFKLGEFEISGQPDILIPLEDGTYELVDFKTTNTVYQDKALPGTPDLKYLKSKKYIGQASLYRHGLAQNGIVVSKAKLYYFARNTASWLPCLTVRIDLDDKLIEEALENAREITEHFKNKTLPSYKECYKENGGLCRNYCEYNYLCWQDAEEKGEK
jgi:hypothetical protein